jgi:hypothetical protein
MTDIVNRAKRLLEPTAHRNLVPGPVAGSDVVSRAQQLLNGSTAQQQLVPRGNAGSSITATAPIIRVPMTCGKFGRPFVAIGEIHGKNFLLVRNAAPQGVVGSATASAPSPAHLGSFNILAAPEWCCPHCHSRANSHPLIRGEIAWQCGCPAHNGALHCIGSDAHGGTYCACGTYELRSFVSVSSLEVHAERVMTANVNRPAAQGRAADSPQSPSSTALPRSPAPPPTPQLTWKR